LRISVEHEKKLTTESVQWLIEHTPPFAKAYVALNERRGKTILHEDVTIARVSDLSLKVAIEKSLGCNVVSLQNNFIAFPPGFLPDVQRVVECEFFRAIPQGKSSLLSHPQKTASKERVGSRQESVPKLSGE
jgi:hypothetical protein